MAYGLPASFALEKGLPSAPTSVNGPPKLLDAGALTICGGRLLTCGSRSSAAPPATASATRAHNRIRTCLRLRRGGRASSVMGGAFAKGRQAKQRRRFQVEAPPSSRVSRPCPPRSSCRAPLLELDVKRG